MSKSDIVLMHHLILRTDILISLNRKMPIREFYLDRILAELELSHDEVSAVSSVVKSYVTGLSLRLWHITSVIAEYI